MVGTYSKADENVPTARVQKPRSYMAQRTTTLACNGLLIWNTAGHNDAWRTWKRTAMAENLEGSTWKHVQKFWQSFGSWLMRK